MSGRYTARPTRATPGLGEMLRDLRNRKGVSMWRAAADAGMDPTHLSKIERGHRLPTKAQAAALAAYFGVPASQISAALMIERFRQDAAKNPAAGEIAAALIAESAGEYRVKKRPTAGNNRSRVVNNPKKKK